MNDRNRRGSSSRIWTLTNALQHPMGKSQDLVAKSMRIATSCGLLVLSSGCAMFHTYDRPMPDASLPERPPFKVVAVTYRASSSAIGARTEEMNEPSAAYKYLTRSGKTEEGIIFTDKTAVLHTLPFDFQPREWEIAVGSRDHIEYFARRQDELIARGAADLFMQAFDRVMAKRRYATMHSLSESELVSFDIRVLPPSAYKAPSQSSLTWVTQLTPVLQKLELCDSQPSVVPPDVELRSAQPFIDSLHQDFPHARISLADHYVQAAKLKQSMRPEDRILHFAWDVDISPPLGVVVANSVLTAVSLTLIPTVLNQHHVCEVRLEDGAGETAWQANERVRSRFMLWLPMIGWSFGKDTSIFTGFNSLTQTATETLLREAITDGLKAKGTAAEVPPQ